MPALDLTLRHGMIRTTAGVTHATRIKPVLEFYGYIQDHYPITGVAGDVPSLLQ